MGKKILSESANESTNVKKGFKLNFDLSQIETLEAGKNQSAWDRFAKLAKGEYYFTIQPKTNRYGESYAWITATKRGEDREEFSLHINNDVLGCIASVLSGEVTNISDINADENLEAFNAEVANFELALYEAERAQGKTMKMTHTTTGQTYASYYKRGVIIYKPYLNPELKAYVNA